MDKETQQKETQLKAKQYIIDAKQLQDIMKYLMARPYAEVYALMHIMTSLQLLEHNGGKDVDKK